jgi:hypothetical protein
VDADSDNDGLSDGVEMILGTDPLNGDSDGDTVCDGTEYGLTDLDIANSVVGGDTLSPPGGARTDKCPPDAETPDDPAAEEDPDAEGDPLAPAVCTSFVSDRDPTTTTDPGRADTDGDGRSDGEEDWNQDGMVGGVPHPTLVGQTIVSCTSLWETAKVTLCVSWCEFDPTDPKDILADFDADGLSNIEECGFHLPSENEPVPSGVPSWPGTHTDELNPDTDGDGLFDGFEVNGVRTDPLKVDTDDGGVPDGAEVAAGTNPNLSGDDFKAGQLSGSGSEPASCGSQPRVGAEAAGLMLFTLLFVVLMLGSRSSRKWLCIFLLLIPAPADAQEAEKVNLSTWTTHGGPYRIWTLEQSPPGPHLQPYGSIQFRVETDSVRLDVEGFSQEVLPLQVLADLNLGVGLFGWVQIDMALPLVLEAQGGGTPSGVADFSGAGLGDLVLRVRTRLLDNRAGGAGLGLTVGASAPTGNDGGFRSDIGFGILTTFIFDFRAPRFTTALNVGARFRTYPSKLFDTIVDHDLTFGAGFEVDAWRGYLDLAVEVFGRTELVAPFQEKRATTLELVAGPRIRLFRELELQLAAGGGILLGRGAPRFRGLVSLVWVPQEPDPDLDLVLAFADRCPIQPEDRDGYRDGDGCPDEDDDGDGIPDSRDACPRIAEDFNLDRDEDGCPDADHDGDGRVDVHDRCPYEPEDVDNFQDADGCPDPDNDNDAIIDLFDQCPLRAETYNGYRDEDGCPDAREKNIGYCLPECAQTIGSVLIPFSETDRRDPKPTDTARPQETDWILRSLQLGEMAATLAAIKGNSLIEGIDVVGYAVETERKRFEAAQLRVPASKVAWARAHAVVALLNKAEVHLPLSVKHDRQPRKCEQQHGGVEFRLRMKPGSCARHDARQCPQRAEVLDTCPSPKAARVRELPVDN